MPDESVPAATAETPHVAAPNAPITEKGGDGKKKRAQLKQDDLFDLTEPIAKAYKPDKNAHYAEQHTLTKVINMFNISMNYLHNKIVTAMGVKNGGGKTRMTENLYPPIIDAQENWNKKWKQRALELGERFVNSIMENEYEPIPDSGGMSVLRNVSTLEIGETHDMVLRNITIPFWQQCLKLVDTSGMLYRVDANGASDIGKSTATAILIRMLLKDDKTVVYVVHTPEKEGWYYEFVPGPNNSIVTKVYPETIERNKIPSLQVETTYYIADPSRTKDDCNPPSKFAPKVILVTSLDSGHSGAPEFENKKIGVRGFFESMPLWTLEELLSAQPVLCPKLTVRDVRALYRLFDGVPHDVFRDYSNELILKQKMATLHMTSFFDKDAEKRKVILERMICAYIHEKQEFQPNFPNTRHCYTMHDGFSEIDSYWIDKIRGIRFKETFNRGILYRPEIVDELMKLVEFCLKDRNVTEGIMIKGSHGIGKSHSIINLIRKLLYDSNGKYFVTFVPDCEKWTDLGCLYDAICNSFGCTRIDLGLNHLGDDVDVKMVHFKEFIAAIDEILARKGMKWVFIFDQINALFSQPVLKDTKDVVTLISTMLLNATLVPANVASVPANAAKLPFPFSAIKNVMKGSRIISIISASANNEISYKDNHPDFLEYDHTSSMSAAEINAVFHEVVEQDEETRMSTNTVTGGVPLQVANLISFAFSMENYQDDAVESIQISLQKLKDESTHDAFQQITESAVASVLFMDVTALQFDRKYSIRIKHGGGVQCYKPLFPAVLFAYRLFFWDSIMITVTKKEKDILAVCKDTQVTADVRGRLFELLVINCCLHNANVTIDFDWGFPSLQNCQLVEKFTSHKLPKTLTKNGMYVPLSPNFPAIDLIWKCDNCVCGVQVHISTHEDTLERFEALCIEAGWFEDQSKVFMLYLSPTTNATASMQNFVTGPQEGNIEVAAVSVANIACLADMQW